MTKKKIIIDCDPGQDDAIALLLAFASLDYLEILGITTVAGNVQLKSTQRNARLLCEMFGQNRIPVFAGCEKPLFRKLVTAEEYHGIEGLNGIPIYEPKKKLEAQHAVDFIIEKLMGSDDHSIYMVGIAPLTNIGMAILKKPEIVTKIKEIVLMGGSYKEGGNITAAAEFNFYVDPHAANIVLTCGCPVTIFGLDATHQTRVTKDIFEKMQMIKQSKAKEVLITSIEYFNKAYKDIYNQDAAPIHDVLTICYLLNPSIFHGIKRNISVETVSELTMGASIVDEWDLSKKSQNATWITNVDKKAFFELLQERITNFNLTTAST